MSTTRSIAVVGTSPGYRVELKMKLPDLMQLIEEELEAFQQISDVEKGANLTAAQAKAAKLDVLVNQIADIMGVQADLDINDKEGIAQVIDAYLKS